MSYNFRLGALPPYTDEIVQGVLLTLQLSLVTMLIGLVIGLFVALGSTSPLKAVRVPVRIMSKRSAIRLCWCSCSSCLSDCPASDAKIRRYDDDATAAAAFTSGQAQLLATADVVAKDMSDKNPSLPLKAKFILQFSPCYIGVQQGAPELLHWLNTYVHLGMLNGSLSALSEKWNGNKLPAQPTI